MDINNTGYSQAMLDWVANLFSDPHKKSGFIICEIERCLPAQGCSLGIASVKDGIPSSILNRGQLSVENLDSIFQKTKSEVEKCGGGDAVCRLEIPSVQDNGYYIFIHGPQDSVVRNEGFLRMVLARAIQKGAEQDRLTDTEAGEGQSFAEG